MKLAFVLCVVVAACGPRSVIFEKDELRYLEIFEDAARVAGAYCESHPSAGEFVQLGVEGMERMTAERSEVVAAPSTDPGELEENSLHYFRRCYRHFSRHTTIPLDSLALGATRFAIESLDPNAAVIDLSSGGIGAVIARHERGVVVFPATGGPAYEAGVRAGDLVIEVDGHRTKGASLSQFVGWVRGAVGSECALTLRRPGVDDPRDVRVVRAANFDNLPATKSQVIRSGVGYVKLRQITHATGVQLVNALESLRRDHNIGSLILDLRETNTGGFENACAVIDVFLSKGQLAAARWHDRSQEERVDASPMATLPDAAMIVLVGPGTAFAGEVVAGALQESGRASLMGGSTAGAGAIMRTFKIGERHRLWLPVGRFVLPSGRALTAGGLEPDIPFAGDGRETIGAAADRFELDD